MTPQLSDQALAALPLAIRDVVAGVFRKLSNAEHQVVKLQRRESALRAENVRLERQVRDVSRERDQWRRRAMQAEATPLRIGGRP